jgi:hypothetical protein
LADLDVTQAPLRDRRVALVHALQHGAACAIGWLAALPTCANHQKAANGRASEGANEWCDCRHDRKTKECAEYGSA